MRRRTLSITILLLVVISALAFVVAVPMASVEGGVPDGPACFNFVTLCRIHYTESLSCYLLGGFPMTSFGDYYFRGELGIGCGPKNY
jgi:hypothetical protein